MTALRPIRVRIRAAVATVATAGLLTATAGTLPAPADSRLGANPAGITRSVAATSGQSASSYVSVVMPTAAKKSSVKRVTTKRVKLRKGPGKSHRVITVLRKGRVVRLAGRTARGYVKVSVGSRRGWLSKQYLGRVKKTSASASSGSRKSYSGTERRLTAKTVRVHRALRAAFPRIKTVHGYRPGSAGEHRLGRALDVMLPGNYRSASARALGKRIATWARSRAGSLKIMYVIWDQRIWNSQRSGDGWRRMSNGGSASANHKNHVHISVKR